MAPWAVRVYCYDAFRTGQGPMLRFLGWFVSAQSARQGFLRTLTRVCGDQTVILRFAYQHEILAGKQGKNPYKHVSAGRIAQKKRLGGEEFRKKGTIYAHDPLTPHDPVNAHDT